MDSPEFCIEMGNDLTNGIVEKITADFDTILISLFVPKAKPLNHFDIEDAVLSFLEKLFLTKNCILYVFGNPYALQVVPNLKNANGIIEMYQDFIEFQETAAKQLLNNTICKGSLPVAINSL